MEERICIYIKKINDSMGRYVNNHLKSYGLTMSQGRVIRYLHENENRKVTQKEIEEKFNITHATLSGIIARLETNGFIKVDRSKRSNVVTLLEKSYINEKEVKEYQEKIERIACKGFSGDEIDVFINHLKLVYENVKEENFDA